MRKHHLFSTLALLALPSLSFAFFCPSNFNQIQMGYTIAQVTANCGKPDFQKEASKSDDNVPQQWSYFVPQTNIIGPRTATPQGSQQAVMSFDENGNLVNVMINNVSVGSTNVCGQSIQVGDQRDKIKTACGTPTFISKQTEPTDGSGTSSGSGSASSAPEVKVTQFTYNSKPPVTLIFENGILTQKK